MKRYKIPVLLLLLCLSLIACGRNNGNAHDPVDFYYRNEVIEYGSVQGLIAAEVRDRSGYENDTAAFIDLYLRGPETEGLLSPFPAGTCVESVRQEDTIFNIILNNNFSNLSGHNLSVACACLSMTLMDLTQCDTVRIYVADGSLDGSEYVEMSADSVLLLDKYTIPSKP